MADLEVLVSDFGLFKLIHDDDDYYMLKHYTLLPVRWTAPENLIDMRFSSNSLNCRVRCLDLC